MEEIMRRMSLRSDKLINTAVLVKGIVSLSALLLFSLNLIFPNPLSGHPAPNRTMLISEDSSQAENFASSGEITEPEKPNQEKSSKPDQESQAEKKDDKERKKPEAKLFQLEPVYIEVVDKASETEKPTMTVIPMDRFPLTISHSLDTALERQPGIEVQRLQAIGSALDDDSVKIRGLGARRLLLLRDGRLLNSSGVAGGYFIDWTAIPLTAISRIEVIKGITDTRFGNTLGGVINLIPKSPDQHPAVELQTGYASFNTSNFSLYHSWKPGRFDYTLAASLTDSDGYLRNGNYNLKNSELRLGYDLPIDGRLSFEATYLLVKKGFAVFNRVAHDPLSSDYNQPLDDRYPASDGEYMYGGMGAYPEPGAWWKKDRLLLSFNYDQSLGQAGTFRLNAWKNYGNREAYNTRQALDRIFHKKFYDDRSWGGGFEYRLPIFAKETKASGSALPASLLAGFNFSYLKDDGDTNYPDDFRQPFRNGYYVASKIIHAYLQADLPLSKSGFFITPGLRFMSYQGISGPGGLAEGIPNISMSGLAPSLKLTYLPGAWGLFYLTVARGLRFPTPPEHYWHYDADDAGVDTHELLFKAEDGLLLEAGWKYETESKMRLELSVFHYNLKNFIQFDLINFVSYNIGRARLYGLEAEIARQLNERFSAFANVSLFTSRTSGDPLMELFVREQDRDFHKIPGVPAFKTNLGLRWIGPGQLRVAGFIQAASRQEVVYNNNLLWNDELQVVNQKGYVRFDLETSFPVPALKALVSGFIHNLFNASYQERFGFPAAGRSAGINIRFNF